MGPFMTCSLLGAGIEDVFIKQSDVKVSADGSVTIDVCVDCLFTVTTMTSAGHKGSFSPSPPVRKRNGSLDFLPVFRVFVPSPPWPTAQNRLSEYGNSKNRAVVAGKGLPVATP